MNLPATTSTTEDPTYDFQAEVLRILVSKRTKKYVRSLTQTTALYSAFMLWNLAAA